MKSVWILSTIGVCFLASVQLASEQVASAKEPGPFNSKKLFPSNDTSLNILKNEEIKNRHIVVVSVVGADPTAQTLILNIFLKFLHAQYEKHDLSDWIGEKDANSTLDGFEWTNDTDSNTPDIRIWPHIFTHDYDNGEKVAIILLDTQLTLSPTNESKLIFALSSMYSSIQCYNLMGNFTADDLEYFEMFAKQGNYAIEEEKPFQKLHFVIRDWSNVNQRAFGSVDQRNISDLFQNTNVIQSKFNEIGATLLPSPGKTVKIGQFTGLTREISGDFIKYVEEMASALLAPENILTKKVNGKVMRPEYLMFFFKLEKIFKGLQPEIGFRELLKIASSGSFFECIKQFVEEMSDKIDNVKTYLKSNELIRIFNETKAQSIAKCENAGRPGNSRFKDDLENSIEVQFDYFKNLNGIKLRNAQLSAVIYYGKLREEIIKEFKAEIYKEIDKTEPDQICSTINQKLSVALAIAFEKFNASKYSKDEELSGISRKYFEEELLEFKSIVDTSLSSYNNSIKLSIILREDLHRANKLINEMDYEHQLLNFNDYMEKVRKAAEEPVEHFLSLDAGIRTRLTAKIEQFIQNEFDKENITKAKGRPGVGLRNDTASGNLNGTASSNSNGILSNNSNINESCVTYIVGICLLLFSVFY